MKPFYRLKFNNVVGVSFYNGGDYFETIFNDLKEKIRWLIGIWANNRNIEKLFLEFWKLLLNHWDIELRYLW